MLYDCGKTVENYYILGKMCLNAYKILINAYKILMNAYKILINADSYSKFGPHSIRSRSTCQPHRRQNTVRPTHKISTKP